MKDYIVEANNIPQNMKLYGVSSDFHRLPGEIAKNVSANVYRMCDQPAGGRLRFRTDSEKIGIKAYLLDSCINSGIDVLSDGIYCGKVRAWEDEDNEKYYEGVLSLSSSNGTGLGKLHEVTVFLPRVVHVDKIVISLDDNAQVLPCTPYKIEKPIVWYGSSITHGGSSNSPSKCYVALVSEMLGANHVNLGFGGSAKGEKEMAEYIATLDMTAFIMDYEHNSSSVEELKITHKRFFDIIRKAQPDLPIMIITRPDVNEDSYMHCCQTRRVIMDTFHQALDNGDTKVDFIDGFYLWGNYERETCTDDGCHPNEKGFARMADVTFPRLQAFLRRCGIEC